jgi:uracil-DNA glycosylase family 4
MLRAVPTARQGYHEKFMTPLAILAQEITACAKCPRLRDHREQVAVVKRRAYRAETYWGRPVPSFGDPRAAVLIVGLAPGAHGANRTGRMFTGDRSGDFLYKALFDTGFASQPTSHHDNDGLRLTNAWITASAHCAPPDNKPLPEEIRNCREFLQREIALLKNVKVVVALGRIAFDSYLAAAGVRTRQPFAHGVECALGPGMPVLIASYHPSQQNTQTGRLTEAMLQAVFDRAARIATSARREGLK